MARQLRKRVVLWETRQIWQNQHHHWLCLHEIEAIPLPAHFYYSPSPERVVRSSPSHEDNLSSLSIFPWICVTQCNRRWPGFFWMLCCSSSLPCSLSSQSFRLLLRVSAPQSGWSYSWRISKIHFADTSKRYMYQHIKENVSARWTLIPQKCSYIKSVHCFLFPWTNSGFIKILIEFLGRLSETSKGIGLDSVFLNNISVIPPLNKVNDFPINCVSVISI